MLISWNKRKCLHQKRVQLPEDFFWPPFIVLEHQYGRRDVMCRSPWWFECCFCRSSCIHCWLLLAVLSGYFGHLVTSTFLLCKFWGLHGSTPVSFPVMSRWKCIGIKHTPGKRAETAGWNWHAEEEADAKRVTRNPGRVCSILNQKR